MSENVIDTRCIESSRFDTGDKLSFLVGGQFLSPFTQSLLYFGRFSESEERVVLKMPKHFSRLRQEWRGSNRVFKSGVSTAQPIAHIALTSDSSEGMVFEFVNGEVLYKTGDLDKRMKFGQITKQMHDLIPGSINQWEASGNRDFSHFNSVTTNWKELPSFSDVRFKRVLLIYQHLAKLVGNYFKGIQPVFLHGDLHDGQLLVDKEKLTLIDFDSCKEGCPLGDLAMYAYHVLRTGSNLEFVDSFFKGYYGDKEVTEKDKMIFAFLLTYTGLRSVEWYSKFIPGKVDYPLDQLTKVAGYIDREMPWKKFK